MKPIRNNFERYATACAPIGLMVCAAPAFAHPGVFAHAHSVGFGAGFAHPLTGIDHLLAMFAIGLWSSRQAVSLRRLTPAVVALGMACGAFLAWGGVPFFHVEFGIAFSVLLAGVCVCTLVRLPAAAGATSIFVLLLLHGHAHGTELAFGTGALQCMAGFMISSALIAAAGGFVGTRVLPSRPPLLRLAGAVVAACGAGLMLNV